MNNAVDMDPRWRSRTIFRIFLVLMLTTIAIIPLASAQNTAMFRADQAHTGIYSSGASELIPNTVLWQFTTNGWVTSTPAISDGIAYTNSADGNLYAIDIKPAKRSGVNP
jgi:hypothetical protein